MWKKSHRRLPHLFTHIIEIVQRIPSSNLPKREAATTKDSVSLFPLSGLEFFSIFFIIFHNTNFEFSRAPHVREYECGGTQRIAQYQNSSARSHTVALVVRYSLNVFEATIWFFGKNTITQCSVLMIRQRLKWIGMFYFKLFSLLAGIMLIFLFKLFHSISIWSA